MPNTPEDNNETTEATDLESALDAAWNNEDDANEDSLTSEEADETEDEVDEDDEDNPDEEGDPDELDDEAPDVTSTEDDSELSQTFTVKVDGEDIEVSLEEALAGYMRQSAFTRRTQELASERDRYAAFEEFRAALAANPQDTLAKLARVYNVDLVQEQQVDPLEDLDPVLADELREVRAVRAELQAERERLAAAERGAAIDAEVEAVRVKFDAHDLDEAELLQFAIDRKIGDLATAYQVMDSEKQANRAAIEAAVKVERKRKAPPIEGGRNRSKGVTTGVPLSEMTLEKAFEMASRGS